MLQQAVVAVGWEVGGGSWELGAGRVWKCFDFCSSVVVVVVLVQPKLACLAGAL